MKKTNKKGFTLAELLIVVAIIAVLVAIAIPVFTSQLEKARQATDVANLRAAYAESAVGSLEADGGAFTGTTKVIITHKNTTWDKLETNTKIGGLDLPSCDEKDEVTVNVSATGEFSFNLVAK